MRSSLKESIGKGWTTIEFYQEVSGDRSAASVREHCHRRQSTLRWPKPMEPKCQNAISAHQAELAFPFNALGDSA